MNINVINYNIRKVCDEQEEANLWQYRKVPLLKLIQKHQPDILCVQEDTEEQITSIRSVLPKHAWYGFYNGVSEEGLLGEFNAIFSSFPIHSSKSFWLTLTPTVRSKVTGSKYYRTMTMVVIEISGVKVHVFNTHLDHKSEEARRQQADQILRIMASIEPERYVLCGDFNGSLEDDFVKKLDKELRLVNKDVGREKTLQDWGGHFPLRSCVDFIFSNLEVVGVDIDRTRYIARDGVVRTPSDHCPIITELKFSERRFIK